MPVTYIPLATQTLGSAAATVTFSSIPAGYTDLVLVSSYKRTTTNSARFRFNSDSGSNYSDTALTGNGTSAASSRTSNATGGFLFNYFSSSTTGFVLSTLHLMNYSNSTTFKTCIERSNDAAQGTAAIVTLWRSTAAITSIVLDANAGNYDTGSTFSLYGIASA